MNERMVSFCSHTCMERMSRSASFMHATNEWLLRAALTTVWIEWWWKVLLRQRARKAEVIGHRAKTAWLRSCNRGCNASIAIGVEDLKLLL